MIDKMMDDREIISIEELYEKILNNEITKEDFVNILTSWIEELIKDNKEDDEEVNERDDEIDIERDNKEKKEMSKKKKDDYKNNEDNNEDEEDDGENNEEDKETNIKSKYKIKLSNSNVIRWVKIYDIKDYYHAGSGEKISYEDLIESIENFNKVHIKSVPVNIEHNDGMVVGRVYDFKIEKNTLKALIEVPKKYLDKYRYFSIEIEEVRDVNTGEKIGKVITGLALTNKPAIASYTTLSINKGLLPKEVVLSFYKKPNYLSLLNKITNKELINKQKNDIDEWKKILKEEFRRKGLIK
jgi:hypothetical protein